MQNYQAMDAIKDSVNPKYYVWYKPTTEALNVKSELFNRNCLQENRPQSSDFSDDLNYLLNIPKIDILELKTATNDWDCTNELGRGGFGVVYKGEWLNTKVAIKKLNLQTANLGSENNWKHVIKSMSELRFINNLAGTMRNRERNSKASLLGFFFFQGFDVWLTTLLDLANLEKKIL